LHSGHVIFKPRLQPSALNVKLCSQTCTLGIGTLGFGFAMRLQSGALSLGAGGPRAVCCEPVVECAAGWGTSKGDAATEGKGCDV